VAILFCGIVMAKYTRDNLSEDAKVLTARQFKVVALLAETFVFVYLGMAAFAFPIWEHTTWAMVVVALVACFLGRLHIYLFSFLTNAFFRSKADSPMPKITLTYMNVMWFSGLRGGVAFAIAAVGYQHNDFPDNGDSLAILQTTLMIALFTIFVMGGLITDIAKATGILDVKGEKPAKKPAHQIPPEGYLGRLDRVHIRPFFTHHSADYAEMVEDEMHDYDEGLRVAAVQIQRSWRRNSPASKRVRVAVAGMGQPSKSTDDIKRELAGKYDDVMKGTNSWAQASMEDKVDELRLKVPGVSSAELRKILQGCGGDMEKALQIASGK